MVLSWSERDAGHLEASFLHNVTSTDSGEESSPPLAQDHPFVFPHHDAPPTFKLFGKASPECTESEEEHVPEADVVVHDESSEEAKFRNGKFDCLLSPQ